MARILVNGEWYEQVAPTAFYETEFESVLLHQAPTLYPDFLSTDFKALVTTEQGESAKADLALIDRHYREWWVVEVEMGHHSLDGHVLPQVRTLATGLYGRTHAEYLAARNKDLDVERVHTLMKGRPPRVLVVVNTPKPEWVEPLARYDALLAVFELFRSSLNQHIYRVNGQHPTSSPDVISDFHCDPLLPNFAVVAAPAALGVSSNRTVTMRFGNGVSDWQRVDAQDKVWLASLGPMPLSRNERYEIVRQDGELVIRVKQKTSRKAL